MGRNQTSHLISRTANKNTIGNSSLNELTQRYFNKLKAAWEPWVSARGNRENIIPFCTPIIEEPDVLLVGVSHSIFQPGATVTTQNDIFSKKYSESPPTVNTYVDHDHIFARNIRDLISARTGFMLTAREERTKKLFGGWVGTNRCSIQFEDPSQDEVIKRWDDPLFEDCQKLSDQTLKELVAEIQPKFVFLCGQLPAALFYEDFYPNQSKDKDELGIIKKEFSNTKVGTLSAVKLNGTTIIPLYYPKQRPKKYKEINISRLKESLVAETLDWSSFY